MVFLYHVAVIFIVFVAKISCHQNFSGSGPDVTSSCLAWEFQTNQSIPPHWSLWILGDVDSVRQALCVPCSAPRRFGRAPAHHHHNGKVIAKCVYDDGTDIVREDVCMWLATNATAGVSWRTLSSGARLDVDSTPVIRSSKLNLVLACTVSLPGQRGIPGSAAVEQNILQSVTYVDAQGQRQTAPQMEIAVCGSDSTTPATNSPSSGSASSSGSVSSAAINVSTCLALICFPTAGVGAYYYYCARRKREREQQRLLHRNGNVVVPAPRLRAALSSDVVPFPGTSLQLGVGEEEETLPRTSPRFSGSPT